VDRWKEFRKIEFVFKSSSVGAPTPLPLSLPPPRTDSSLGACPAERQGVAASSPASDTSSDGKVAALHTYMRACGLC
jgi:hypothetical protein